MSDSKIEYFIWLVILKQNKYPNSISNGPDRANLNFTVWNWSKTFNLMSFGEKLNQNKAFEKLFSIRFSKKHFGFCPLSIKNGSPKGTMQRNKRIATF